MRFILFFKKWCTRRKEWASIEDQVNEWLEEKQKTHEITILYLSNRGIQFEPDSMAIFYEETKKLNEKNDNSGL